MKYHLIHITAGGEFRTPLVASQLFDQANTQATETGCGQPKSVHAWIIGPMRDMIDKDARKVVKALRLRCPSIIISAIGGVNRLSDFPAILIMRYKRMLLGNAPVIYHCRGEAAAHWAIKLRSYFPSDKIVLDIRGHGPAEMLYNRGVQEPYLATGIDAAEYNNACSALMDVITQVDAVTTVSEEMRQELIATFGAIGTTTVVPCCIKTVVDDSVRSKLRKEWQITDDEIVVAYAGTTAAYQHIEDLTLPFLKCITQSNRKVRVMILTPEIEKFRVMLDRAGLTNYILKQLPQSEVAAALTAADAGVLIRKPTLVNRVANPVKIAEYFASGLGLIIENGVGGLPEVIYNSGLVKGIAIAGSDANVQNEAGHVSDWLNGLTGSNRNLARATATKYYSWAEMIKVHRETYLNLLKK